MRDRLRPSGRLCCPDCGHVVEVDDGVFTGIDDRSLSKIDRRNQVVYRDIWARGYDRYREENVTAEGRLLAGWRDYFDVDVLLDAGCGAGRLLETWSACGARTVVFVDVSDAIHQCRENWLRSFADDFDAIFIKASVKNLPLRDRAVDSVWCAGTIACTDDQSATMRELLRVGDGALLLGTITEKTLTGKIYLLGNVVRPVLRRVASPAMLFRLAGGLARLAWLCIHTLCFLGRWSRSDSLRDLRKVIARDDAVARLQYALFDPLAAPTGRKFADEFYIGRADDAGYALHRRTTSSVCDYFEFVRPTV